MRKGRAALEPILLALPVLLSACIAGKLALVPGSIPRSIPVVLLNAAVLLAAAPRLLRSASLRAWAPLLSCALVLVPLAAETAFFLPALFGDNPRISAYFFFCAMEALAVLFYGARSLAPSGKVPVLCAVLAFQALLLRKILSPSGTFPYLLYAVTFLLFGLGWQMDIIAAKNRQTRDLLRKQEELNEQLAGTGKRILEQEKQAALARITAGIAHEINNPLSHVRGDLPFLEKDVLFLAESADKAPLPEAARTELVRKREEARSIIAKSYSGLTRIADIVASLRRIYGAKSAALDTHDMASILERSIGYSGIRGIGGVACISETMGPLPYRCTPGDFYIVFSNLISNAIDAVDGRGTVRISAAASGGGMRIAVEDDGCGIAPKDLTRVFDPFFSTKAGGHMGIGLTLCRNILALYGGNISIESEQGSRTRVTVDLPKEKA